MSKNVSPDRFRDMTREFLRGEVTEDPGETIVENDVSSNYHPIQIASDQAIRSLENLLEAVKEHGDDNFVNLLSEGLFGMDPFFEFLGKEFSSGGKSNKGSTLKG